MCEMQKSKSWGINQGEIYVRKTYIKHIYKHMYINIYTRKE